MKMMIWNWKQRCHFSQTTSLHVRKSAFLTARVQDGSPFHIHSVTAAERITHHIASWFTNLQETTTPFIPRSDQICRCLLCILPSALSEMSFEESILDLFSKTRKHLIRFGKNSESLSFSLSTLTTVLRNEIAVVKSSDKTSAQEGNACAATFLMDSICRLHFGCHLFLGNPRSGRLTIRSCHWIKMFSLSDHSIWMGRIVLCN